MVAKYYIYAGGRWCEVETRRGRVSGWRQRARFCFLRGGRLDVARSAPVLRALRALASGAGSAARDAAPLPYARRHRPRRKSVAPAHVCCAHHLHHSRCDLNANELGNKPPPIQTVTPVASPRKRKRSTSEELSNKAKQAKNEQAWKAAKQAPSPQKKKTDVKAQDEEVKLVQILLQSASEDNSKEKRKRTPQISRNGVLRSKDENSVQNSQSSKTGKEQKAEIIRSKEEEEVVQSLLQSSSDETGEQRKKPQREKLHSSIEDGRKQRQSPQKAKLPQKQIKKIRSTQEEKLVQSLLQSSSEDNDKEQAPKLQTARRSKPRHYQTDSSSDLSVRKEGRCKELIIDETEVNMMRKFLSKTVGRVELDRFDNDEKYKTRVFYKLNPLVSLQRCKSMEQLLLQRLTLKEFARHLGLRSVADVTPEKRYRMRHSTRQARHVTSDSDTDKENAVQPKRRQLWNRDKEIFNSVRSSRSSEVKGKPQIPKPPKPASESSPDRSDSDAEVKQHIRRHLERRASVRQKPRREKTATGKDESFVVSDDSDSRESRRNLKQTRAKGVDKGNESVVVSDDSNENQGKSKRSRATDETKSVVVSDDTDSDTDSDENRGNTRRTRAAKNAANNESVVVSDDSDSDTDKKRKSRRTRSQGPDKRVLREKNKSLVISDDTDSNIDESQAEFKSKSKAPEPAKAQSKSVVVSDETSSNTDENQRKFRRIRSIGPVRALKENNNDSNKKEDTDNKRKKEVDTNKPNRTTRSSMKGADNDSRTKEVYKTETSKKDQPASSKTDTKRKEKPASKEVTKESKKTDGAKEQDKSVISDSDNAFETSKVSPKKQRRSFGDLIRNINGRFGKKTEGNRRNEKHRTGDKNSKVSKASENRIAKEKEEKGDKDENKGNEKHTTEKDNKQSKTRNQIIEKDGKGNKNENKVEKLRTDKYEKSRVEKHRTEKEKDRKEGDKSEKKNERAAVANMFVKPVKFKKSSVANGREYTSLEDHAIVAWLSVGGRERSVNGNAIWRELQQEYTKLTSQTRSWHSLRNRYLRYILPSLASLALPPAQVSRLRAAAATGKLKSRPGYRRNSMFSAERVRSASAAARRPARDSDSDDHRRERTPPPRRARLGSPSNLSSRSELTSSSKAPSKPPSKLSSPSKSPSFKPSSSKLPTKHTSPAKRSVAPSPSKRDVPPSPKRGGASPRTSRLRLRPSSTPTPQKKRRIHHL